jgi:hypothetical protein
MTIRTLREAGYEEFISFEWEKRWHPGIEPPDVALPAFMTWWREQLVTPSMEM